MTGEKGGEGAPKPTARQYLRETQPETWRVAADMAETVAVRLEGKPWAERTYLVDAFVNDLAEEMMGADGLDHLVDLASKTLEGDDMGDQESVVQMIAAIRSILTAALIEIEPEDETPLTDIQCEEQALLLMLAEKADYIDPARAYAVKVEPKKLANHLLPFPALIALLIADRALGPGIEPLTTLDHLLELYQPARAD